MPERKQSFRVKLKSLADGGIKTADDLEILEDLEDQGPLAEVMIELADVIAAKLDLPVSQIADLMDSNKIRTKRRGDMVYVQVR